MSYNTRTTQKVDYTPFFAGEASTYPRRILPNNATGSIIERVNQVSKDASILRVHNSIINTSLQFSITKVSELQQKRNSTDAQGHSCSNSDLSPSRHNHARHMQPVSTTYVEKEEISNHVENAGMLTPKTDKVLKAGNVKTPQRKAVEKSPLRAGEILNKVPDKINILANTHFGKQQHLTVSGLVVSNDFDRMVEFRIRPIWDKLNAEVKALNKEPFAASLEFLEALKEILLRLKNRAEGLDERVKSYLDNRDPALRTEILNEFRTIRMISNMPFVTTDKEKEDTLKAAANVKLEATYQWEAVSVITELHIDNILNTYFPKGETEGVLELLSNT